MQDYLDVRLIVALQICTLKKRKGFHLQTKYVIVPLMLVLRWCTCVASLFTQFTHTSSLGPLPWISLGTNQLLWPTFTQEKP